MLFCCFSSEAVSVPVVANGGIKTIDDAKRCLMETKAQAVMSGSLLFFNFIVFQFSFSLNLLFFFAAGLMTNPALFEGKVYDPCDLALEFVDILKSHPVSAIIARGVLVKMILPLFVTIQIY